MGSHLRKHPEDEGVHYSDLFEQFLPVTDKPRRLLADWLPEYFFKTTHGTWRPPANEQEREQKTALRQTGTLRRIKRFANALIEGVPVRGKDRPGSDVDLLDWLRQCRRAGLYEQGKAIYEKGGLNLANLTDEQQIEAEDDYRICVRRGRDEETKPRRQRPKTTEDDQEETTMTKTLYGKVHGKTIELDEDLGVAEGQEVEVHVRMIGPKKRLPGPPPGWRPGGTETAAGMMAEHWTEEDDRILEAIERDRHRPSTRELPE